MPTLLIPVPGLEAVVAPVIVHVKRVTAQLSAVVGLVVTTDATQVPAPTLAVTFDEHDIVGLILSLIVTVNEQVDVLPAASETVYTTVVTPVLKVYVPTLLIPVAPLAAVVAPLIDHVNCVTEQLSDVVGLVVTTLVLHKPAVTLAVTLDGQVIVGLMLSLIVTVYEHVAVLPATSVIK